MHVMGIDAGGTKTVCLLADRDGRVIARARGAGANLKTAGELGVEKVLHQVMEEVLGPHERLPFAICLGMAGADREGDSRVVRGILRRIGFKARTLVVNDALIALVAGAGNRAGVAVLAGTGSIAYGRDSRNRAARAGGWGHVMGDEGSGYWIGRRALSAVTRQGDGRGPSTLLTGAVFRHFGVDAVSGLVHAVYDVELPPHAVAALCPLVQSCHEAGDPIATTLLTEAAAELALAAGSVVARLELAQQEFPFVLSGGVFDGARHLRDQLETRLREIAPRSTSARLEAEPAEGAVRLALAEAAGGVELPTYI